MDNKKIVWLASYPKSGNTWFRAFLTALLNDGEVDINNLRTDAIFSGKNTFDDASDLPSEYLTEEEVRLLLPTVFSIAAKERVYNKPTDKFFIKIHEAYTLNSANKPVVPSEVTYGAIYFVRHPFDVAISYANHLQCSIDEAIAVMNNENVSTKPNMNNLNSNFTQFNQLLLSWGNHVKTWLSVKEFPVLVIRYEDMLNNSLETFTKAVDFLGLSVESQKVAKAIEASSFDNLKKQEQKNSFREKLFLEANFFNKGIAGRGEKELTELQRNTLLQKNIEIMKVIGYVDSQ